MKKIFQGLLVVFPIQLFAGGFQINTQGVKSTGMGGAYSGIAADASCVFFNPACMAWLGHHSCTIGISIIFPKTSYLSPLSGNVNMERQTFTPVQFYFSYHINDKWSAGLGVNNPYGLGTKWGDDWEGKYVTQKILLQSFYFQPAVAYKVNEKISVGAGFVYALGSAEVRKAVPVQDSVHAFGETLLKGNGNGFGFNAGVFVKFTGKLSVGISHKSSVKIDLKNGTATFTNIPSSLADNFPASTNFNSNITLPSVSSVGVAYKFSDQLTATAEANFTAWSSYDSLIFEFPNAPSLTTRSPRKFKDVMAFRFGAQYKFSDAFTFRFGGAMDQSPVQDGYLNPDLPDADKIVITGGASFQFSKRLSADIAYMFEQFKQREGNSIEAGMEGTYRSSVTVTALGLNYDVVK